MTEKQRRFAQEYLIDCNATQAAIRAGYSEKTARSQGQRLLTNVDIQKMIAAESVEQQARIRITQDDVLKELSEIAMLSPEKAAEQRVRTSDKIKALELLGRHFGMFVDRVEQTTEWADGIHVNITVKDHN